MSETGLRCHTRGPLPLPGRPYDYRHTPAEALAALAPILLRGTGDVPPRDDALRRAAPRPIIYSVHDKSGQLLAWLRSRGRMSLRDMFAACRSRSELVATFLSVLELCADGRVTVAAENGGYEITGVETEAEE